MNKDVTAVELNEEMQRGKKPVLVDVREAHELEISKLPFDHHIPLGEIPTRYSELNPEDDIVIYCRTGGRSGQAAEYLRGMGFKSVRNMLGGMNGWSDTVDPSVTKY